MYMYIAMVMCARVCMHMYMYVIHTHIREMISTRMEQLLAMRAMVMCVHLYMHMLIYV